MHQSPDGRFLLSAAAVWGLSALVLLCLAALTANLAGFGEAGLGRLSSAISFLAAAAAGAAAARKRQKGGFVTALLTATALVILLLTVGVIAEGRAMDPSAVLSVASFTYAGCLVGAVLFPRQRKKQGKHKLYT